MGSYNKDYNILRSVLGSNGVSQNIFPETRIVVLWSLFRGLLYEGSQDAYQKTAIACVESEVEQLCLLEAFPELCTT